MQTISLKLSQLKISKERLLETNLKIVKELKTSIKTIGLIHPITVNKDYEVISGIQRLEALKSLNYIEIPCIIKDIDELKEELMQIDENLVRRQLSPWEESKLLAKQKEIYEILNPTSTKAFKSKNNSKSENERVETTESFSSVMAEKLDCTPKSITNKVSQYESIKDSSPSLEKSISTIDKDLKIKGVDLSTISKFTPQEMDELSKQIEENFDNKDFSISKILSKEKIVEKTMNEKLHEVFMYDLFSVATEKSISDLTNKIKVNEEEAKKFKNELKADFTNEIQFLINSINKEVK